MFSYVYDKADSQTSESLTSLSTSFTDNCALKDAIDDEVNLERDFHCYSTPESVASSDAPSRTRKDKRIKCRAHTKDPYVQQYIRGEAAIGPSTAPRPFPRTSWATQNQRPQCGLLSPRPTCIQKQPHAHKSPRRL